MDNTADFSWTGLFKISAVLLPLAGFLAFCSKAVQVYLDTQPLQPLPIAPNGFSQNYLQSFDFIGFHASSFNLEYSLLSLAVLAFLPAAIALFVALRRTDAGISTVGTALAVVGVVFVLLAAVDAFTQIQEAVVWDGGCSTCGTTPIYFSFGSGTYSAATQLGELLVVVGILVMSILMLKSTSFSRISGIIGIVAALYALAGSFFIFPSLSEMNSDLGTAIIFALLTLWGISVAPKFLKLGRPVPNPP